MADSSKTNAHNNKRQKTAATTTTPSTMPTHTGYYDILGVSKDATDAELRKAYKKMAVKYHPDKHASKSDEEKKIAEEQFKLGSEAYDVLSDPDKRAVYDRYGEAGLKAGLERDDNDNDGNAAFGGGASRTGGSSSYPGGTSSFGGRAGRPGPYGPGYNFSSGGVDPSSFFANFTHASNQRQRSYGETPFDGPGGLEEMLFGGGGGAGAGSGGNGAYYHRDNHRNHVPERIVNTPCTLEELYNGKTKKMKVTRKSLTPGRPTTKILEVPIRPGLKAGTKIRFSGEGDELQTGLSEDLVFVIREKKHPRFLRDGDDLHYTIRLGLEKALCGFTHDILMLDDKPNERVKRIHQKVPVSNVSTRVLDGEGMPIYSSNDTSRAKKGDLIISYVVEFPTTELSEEQKTHIRSCAFKDSE